MGDSSYGLFIDTSGLSSQDTSSQRTLALVVSRGEDVDVLVCVIMTDLCLFYLVPLRVAGTCTVRTWS